MQDLAWAAVVVRDPDLRSRRRSGQAAPGTMLAIGEGLQALPGRSSGRAEQAVEAVGETGVERVLGE
ncbi:hypothetical protein Acsp01_48830 [Actinoplanes sp. NBRC 101535]|nr:hypothetical protein Acsp01_48830 [Actinoplanes sp. NBRC 101535]